MPSDWMKAVKKNKKLSNSTKKTFAIKSKEKFKHLKSAVSHFVERAMTNQNNNALPTKTTNTSL